MIALPWFNGGQPFHPRISVDVYERSQQQVQEVLQRKGSLLEVRRIQAGYVAEVLRASVPNAPDVEIGLVETREAFVRFEEEIWGVRPDSCPHCGLDLVTPPKKEAEEGRSPLETPA